MKRIIYLLVVMILLSITSVTAQNEQAIIRNIYDEALTQSPVYENLRFLTKNIGHRLSGSTGAAAAVEYTRQLMLSYDFDTVFLQDVMVPHWVRGSSEEARIVQSKTLANYEMHCTALGNSVGTGPEGVLGEVIEFDSLSELETLGKEKIKGKIVFFNRSLDATKINTFAAYGGAWDQRGYGHTEAAKYGAIGVIVRSLASSTDHFPHAGSVSYRRGEMTVPAIAISTIDADMLSRELSRDPKLQFYFETNCEMKGEVLSYNVVGQINGSGGTDSYIAVGGHLDSWDLGEGAHDDGSGCMQAIESVRLLKKLGVKPRNNIRAVMWMNEENGLRGGKKYAELANENAEKHIAAIESDRGGFVPFGFTFQTEDKAAWEKINHWKEWFEPYNLTYFKRGGGGSDISPMKDSGVVLISLMVDSQRYFTLHHSEADVFEKVDKRELELGAAAMASLLYLIDKEGF